ncbi:MAG: Gfo/Idh/MocA family protein [Armatimonadota bacterium]
MDKLRIGVIGVCGRGGIANNWHNNKRSEVVGGADVSDKALEDFKSRMGDDVFLTKDYRELLDRKDIDAIAVTAPDFMHEELAVAALQAGKHVFCEKPLAITTDGCDNILRTWKNSKQKLMVGFNMRYMNIFRTMKEIIDSGTIGEVKAAWCRHFVGHGRTFYYQDWHATKKGSNSLLLQKGSHDLDMIHWLTGQYTKKVAAFGGLDMFGGDKPNDLFCTDCDEDMTCWEKADETCSRNQCCFREEVDVEDNNVMIMELDGGIKASYLQCHFTPDYHRNYTIIGTEGRLENTEPEGKVIVKMRRSNSWKELADRTYDIRPAMGGHGGADPVITEDFLDMVLDGKEPLATPVAGRMSVAAGCAGADSMRSGGMMQVVPEIEW